MSKKEFIKDVDSYVIEKLEKLGFTKKKELFYLPIDENTIGVIALPRATRYSKEAFSIAPVIGVINKQVEEIVHELTGQKRKGLTKSEFLGYLMPENSYREWEFHKSIPISFVARNMIKNIKKYGIPWMKKLSNMRYLAEEMEKDLAIPGGHYEALPIIWFLLGEKERAFNHINKVFEKVKGKNPQFEEEYKQFVDKLLQKFS